MTKQILFGAGLWLVAFLLTSVIIILPLPVLAIQILQIIVVAALGFGTAYLFFKDIFGNLQLGIRLGVTWAAALVVIDWILIGIAALANVSDVSIRHAYYSWPWYVALIGLVAATAAAGQLTGNSKSVSPPPRMGPPEQKPPAPPTGPGQPTM